MYRGKTVAVVVPAYDEEGFVGDVIESVPAFVDRIYPVDDASTDGTWDEIRAAAARVDGDDAEVPADGDDRTAHVDGEPQAARVEDEDADGDACARTADPERRVVPLRHEENRGVGGAIKTGYRRARADRMDVTAVMGGDGQMPPEALASIVEPVATGRADYAKGNRLVDAETRAEMPRFRYVGNRILTELTKIASGYWSIEDPQNGYTAISLHALETAEIEDMYEFYGYCNDLLVKLNVEGLRVVDVPVEASYADEESDIEYSTYVPRVSSMLARNALWRGWHSYVVRRRHPLALFAGLAALTGGVGFRRLLKRLRGETDAGVAGVLSVALTSLAATFALDKEHDSHLAEQVEPEDADEETVVIPDAETVAKNGAAKAADEEREESERGIHVEQDD